MTITEAIAELREKQKIAALPVIPVPDGDAIYNYDFDEQEMRFLVTAGNLALLLADEVERLERVIEAAPHGRNCPHYEDGSFDCAAPCWKALAAGKPKEDQHA